MRSIYNLLVLFGIDPLKAVQTIRGMPAYRRDLRLLKNQERSSVRVFPFGPPRPCLGDRHAESGCARGHYFHQDLLVARRIHANKPSRHVDVGSRIDGLVAHIAAFRAVEVVDIRALPERIPNVTFTRADMMLPVPMGLHGYCDSLSCLHAMEHFGLGRYGDPVNYDGYVLGMENLHAMLISGGRLYFSVPIGPQRIEFNSHRVFSVGYLLECFAGRYAIERFSFVDDKGELHEAVPVTAQDVKNNFGCFYGCGILELIRI